MSAPDGAAHQSMDAPPLLSCRGVSKLYGALAAVDDLSFDVAYGQVLGIGGPNGAGKTTLFDVISGLSPSTAGEIIFNGTRIERLAPDEICLRGVARTFQLNAGFDTLSVRENILTCSYFGRTRRRFPGIVFDRETRTRVDELIEFVGLGDNADTQARILPVFQRKLMMIAGALATDPRILFLDEPVGGLVPSEIDEILSLVERIRQRGVTLVVIEHVMRFLLRLSDRVMILDRGKKIYEGSPEELTSNQQVIEIFLGVKTAKNLQKQFSTA